MNPMPLAYCVVRSLKLNKRLHFLQAKAFKFRAAKHVPTAVSDHRVTFSENLNATRKRRKGIVSPAKRKKKHVEKSSDFPVSSHPEPMARYPRFYSPPPPPFLRGLFRRRPCFTVLN